MATPGQLVRCLSEVLPFPLGAVTEIDRALAEHNLRSKGGRGRSAARVTARDASNLLIATVASPISGPTTMRAADTYHSYASLPLRQGTDYSAIELPFLRGLGKGHLFVNAIESLVAAAGSGELRDLLYAYENEPSRQVRPAPEVNIRFMAPRPWAQILIHLNSVRLSLVYEREKNTPFLDRGLLREPAAHKTAGDLWQMREITYRTLLALGQAVVDMHVHSASASDAP